MTDTGKDRRAPIPEHLVQEGETMMAWFVNDFIANALSESEHVDPEKMASQMIDVLPGWKEEHIARLKVIKGSLAREQLKLAESFSFNNVVSYSDWQIEQLRKEEELNSDPELKKQLTKDIEAWWNVGRAATLAKSRTSGSNPSSASSK